MISVLKNSLRKTPNMKTNVILSLIFLSVFAIRSWLIDHFWLERPKFRPYCVSVWSCLLDGGWYGGGGGGHCPSRPGYNADHLLFIGKRRGPIPGPLILLLSHYLWLGVLYSLYRTWYEWYRIVLLDRFGYGIPLFNFRILRWNL